MYLTAGGATSLRHGSFVDVSEQTFTRERHTKRGAKSELRTAIKELSGRRPGAKSHPRDRYSSVLRENAKGPTLFSPKLF